MLALKCTFTTYQAEKVSIYKYKGNALTTTRGEEPEIQGYDPGQGR
jgi:hypothetical protein